LCENLQGFNNNEKEKKIHQKKPLFLASKNQRQKENGGKKSQRNRVTVEPEVY